MSAETIILTQIPPGCAPGMLFVRLCTSTGVLLDAHPVGLDEVQVTGLGTEDAALCAQWLDEHPDESIGAFVYDGHHGHCMAVMVLEPPR